MTSVFDSLTCPACGTKLTLPAARENLVGVKAALKTENPLEYFRAECPNPKCNAPDVPAEEWLTVVLPIHYERAAPLFLAEIARELELLKKTDPDRFAEIWSVTEEARQGTISEDAAAVELEARLPDRSTEAIRKYTAQEKITFATALVGLVTAAVTLVNSAISAPQAPTVTVTQNFSPTVSVIVKPEIAPPVAQPGSKLTTPAKPKPPQKGGKPKKPRGKLGR